MPSSDHVLSLEDFQSIAHDLRLGVFVIRTDRQSSKGITHDVQIQDIDGAKRVLTSARKVIGGHLLDPISLEPSRTFDHALPEPAHIVLFADEQGYKVVIVLDTQEDNGSITFYSPDHVLSVEYMVKYGNGKGRIN